jgi:hypothetical protein
VTFKSGCGTDSRVPVGSAQMASASAANGRDQVVEASVDREARFHDRDAREE